MEHTELFSYFLFAPLKAVLLLNLKKMVRLHPFIYTGTDQITNNDSDINVQSFTLRAGFVPGAVFFIFYEYES